MKIITFTYNREASAILQSTLMSEQGRTDKNIYKPAPTELMDWVEDLTRTHPKKQGYCIPGTWQ